MDTTCESPLPLANLQTFFSHVTSSLRDYDPQAGQNIAGGMSATNVSGTITELWYNAELPYFSELYGQPYPDMTYFEQYGHMTQIVWKGTASVGCATQYCPYGLANAGGIEPYFTVCNYKDPGEFLFFSQCAVWKPALLPVWVYWMLMCSLSFS